MQQHWLSFSSHKLGFLGVVIVEAEGEIQAVCKALQIAGEVGGLACGITGGPVEGFEPKWLNRLITKPEIEEVGEIVPTPTGVNWSVRDEPELGTLH
jgi:hypothetical protein